MCRIWSHDLENAVFLTNNFTFDDIFRIYRDSYKTCCMFWLTAATYTNISRNQQQQTTTLGKQTPVIQNVLLSLPTGRNVNGNKNHPTRRLFHVERRKWQVSTNEAFSLTLTYPMRISKCIKKSNDTTAPWTSNTYTMLVALNRYSSQLRTSRKNPKTILPKRYFEM